MLQKYPTELFNKKGVVKNFEKPKEKHLCQSVRGFACNCTKKDILARVFFCEFWEIFKNIFMVAAHHPPPSLLILGGT